LKQKNYSELFFLELSIVSNSQKNQYR